MQEFSSIIASSYDADSLAPMLTEKSAEGWSIVSIVTAGTNVVAYLSRDIDADDVDTPTADAPAADPVAADPADAPTQAFTPSSAAVEEPAGWGSVDAGPASVASSEPESSTDDAATAEAGTAVTGAAALSDLSTDDATSSDASATPPDTSAGATTADDATATPEPDTPAEPDPDPATSEQSSTDAPADSGVPAGWYADPSGRYELRYWDGAAWTEHVSRAGQQYTDPPVA